METSFLRDFWIWFRFWFNPWKHLLSLIFTTIFSIFIYVIILIVHKDFIGSVSYVYLIWLYILTNVGSFIFWRLTLIYYYWYMLEHFKKDPGPTIDLVESDESKRIKAVLVQFLKYLFTFKKMEG